MKLKRQTLPAITLLLLVAGAAHAQSASTDANASGATSGAAQVEVADATANASGKAAATAGTTVRSKSERLGAIRERGARTAEKALSRTESKLAENARRVQAEVDETASMIVANRLAAEFNTTAEAMVKQEARFKCGWGNLVIAHTLAANAKGQVSTDELIELYREPVRWAQIAAGLGFRLDDVESAVKVETRVARGASQADGRVAALRPVTSPELGAGAGVGANAGTAAGRGSLGVGVNAGANAAVPAVKVGH